MDGERMTDLIMTVFMVLLMAALAWMMRAAATGQIKRNAWVGIRTPALMHCEECWLLGHHAAAQKGIIGCWLAAAVMAVGGVAALLAPGADYLQPASLMIGVLVMVGGLLLGLRDANTMLAKMHGGDRAARP